MLNAMHLQHFKSFRDTVIPEFRKVNLILGRQNVGKTSLLEAIAFASNYRTNNLPHDLYRLLPLMFRPGEGHDGERFWKYLLGTSSKPIGTNVILTFAKQLFFAGTGLTAKGGSTGVSTEFGEIKVNFGTAGDNPADLQNRCGSFQPFPFFTKSAAAQVQLYGEMVVLKRKKEVLEMLKRIDPRLESLDAVAPDNEHRIYAELNDGKVLTLSQLGHGFTRLFELYAGLVVSDSKLALIDEIENGIHYSALSTVFQGLRNISEAQDVQSIITTHSLEAIEAACEVFKDKPEDFQLVRLERTNDNNIRAVAIADESLKIVMASGWEMR